MAIRFILVRNTDQSKDKVVYFPSNIFSPGPDQVATEHPPWQDRWHRDVPQCSPTHVPCAMVWFWGCSARVHGQPSKHACSLTIPYPGELRCPHGAACHTNIVHHFRLVVLVVLPWEESCFLGLLCLALGGAGRCGRRRKQETSPDWTNLNMVVKQILVLVRVDFILLLLWWKAGVIYLLLFIYCLKSNKIEILIDD